MAAHEVTHAGGVPHAEEHAHPGPAAYIKIAFILTAITAVEVGVYYVEALRPLIGPILIVLSVVKFCIVVMYYMHLKFDHPLFRSMFLFGMATAVFTIIAFIALFHGLIPV
jgi:cytochrome c oxidase subunit IV